MSDIEDKIDELMDAIEAEITARAIWSASGEAGSHLRDGRSDDELQRAYAEACSEVYRLKEELLEMTPAGAGDE